MSNDTKTMIKNLRANARYLRNRADVAYQNGDLDTQKDLLTQARDSDDSADVLLYNITKD
jgi:hypothetical protein